MRKPRQAPGGYALVTEPYRVERSWATSPLFYRAPHPEQMTPREFQLAGVEYTLARPHGLIGDVMGLGKTAQAIMISNAIEAQRTLVVCPASLRLNWEREVWKWSTLENVSTYPILKSLDGTNPESNYVFTSYDLLRNTSIFEGFMEQRFDHLILDEAHYLKSPDKNARTNAICAADGLATTAGRITMLSGTILPNQPIECYNAVRLLDWEAIDRMSLNAFREYFYQEGEGFITVKGKSRWSNHVRNVPINCDQLQRALRDNVMVRRLKPQVLHELPAVQWHIVPMRKTAATNQAVRKLEQAHASAFYEMDPGDFASLPIDGAVSTARRELGEAKAKDVLAYVEELIREGVRKIVVCAWHHSVLAVLREGLMKYGLVYMDGNTSPAQKQHAVDVFQEEITGSNRMMDGSPSQPCRIILGQMRPLGEGWTLTAAQDVVFAEPDWVPGVNAQMLDRISRMGQEGSYTIGHLCVVPDSMDETILGRVVEKDISIYQSLDERG